jgi:hypothetical protein
MRMPQEDGSPSAGGRPAACAPQKTARPPSGARRRAVAGITRTLIRRHARQIINETMRLEAAAADRSPPAAAAAVRVETIEEAIERAVLPADPEVETAAETSGRAAPLARPEGLDLPTHPGPRATSLLRRVRAVAGGLIALAFVAVAVLCFAPLWSAAGSTIAAGGTLATTFIWGLWWPALAVSFVLVGRGWCALCPMAAAGAAAQKLLGLNRRVPAWLKRNDSYLLMVGIFLIPWAEETSGMRASPVATGIMLSTILALAVLASVVFTRRAWCRYLCPLGGLAGQCAVSGLVELRPTPEICASQCTERRCFKGSERAPGCPLFNCVKSVDTNRHCSLCLTCVESCPHGSPQLRLRIPARELRSDWRIGAKTGSLLAFCVGLVAGLVILIGAERGAHPALLRLVETFPFAFKTTVLLVCTLGSLALVRLAAPSDLDAGIAERYWKRVGAWFPMLAGGLIAYQLAFVPAAEAWEITLALRHEAFPWTATIRVLSAVRLGVLLGALSLGAVVLARLVEREPAFGARRWMRLAAPQLAGMLCFAGVVMYLL